MQEGTTYQNNGLTETLSRNWLWYL